MRINHSLAALTFVLIGTACTPAPPPADLVITNARIYTADNNRSMVEAMAIREGKVVFVGNANAAKKWIGSQTKVEDLGGKLVLPGLIDSHLHPPAMADMDRCDLNSEGKSLRDLSAFVRGCIERFHIPEGKWVHVHQWNIASGNQPDAEYPTLRAALDKASSKHPIYLNGNDFHRAAYNSMAFATARNHKGETIGLSKATLRGEFASLKKLVSVDAQGEPSGLVGEEARYVIDAPPMVSIEEASQPAPRESIMRRINSAGITGVLDAAAVPGTEVIYDNLYSTNKLTLRATLAQLFPPESYRDTAGNIDYTKMVELAKATRAKYATHPLIHADFAKLFADGVIEGDPNSTPPTLPHGASLRPYLQPILARDANGKLTVMGYVDTSSDVCKAVQAKPESYEAPSVIKSFVKEHGFYPAQCTISNGQLEHDRDVIMEFVKQFHLAGFSMHIHAIGDLAVKTAVDAIEAAHQADGVTTTHDSLAHVQLASDEDVARIGRNHLYIAYTYSWANTDPDYDMTVVPFFDHVSGNRTEDFYAPGNYYASHVFPFLSTKKAGAILVAGSDAPTGATLDPIPFINMATAVTRHLPGRPAQNPSQRIGIRDVLDAYTINGARFLGWGEVAGSLETGKSADFIVVDRDILALADANKADDIRDTKVLQTWFKGVQVYQRQ